jgi:hypothetical protein
LVVLLKNLKGVEMDVQEEEDIDSEVRQALHEGHCGSGEAIARR